MINTLLGIKKGMTSTYDARGRRVGATIIELTPNVVTQIKTTEGKDGYNAVQIGFGSKKKVAKPQLGHLKKVGVENGVRFLREVRTSELEGVEPGQQVKVTDIFKSGDAVKVTATSKGKGFQGGMKRHGFHGGPKTHGQSDRHRAPGSIGTGTTPGRVLKGKKMAGHMGMDTVSLIGLEVIAIDRNENLMTVKGGIPGPIGGLIRVEKQGVIKGYTPPPEPEPEEEEEVATEGAEPQMDETVDSGEAKDEAQEVAAAQTEEAVGEKPAEEEAKGEENA